MVTHHPVAARTGGGSGNPFGDLAAIVQTNLTFHAFLMLVAVGQFVGLILLARRLGLHRPVVLTGLLFCGIATILMIVAMTFDGFVIYELISRCVSSGTGCAPGVADSLRLSSAIIQAFTKLGFGAQCLGFCALGIAMWRLGVLARAVAAVCVIAALAPFVIITSGGYVGPQQLMSILALLAAWGLVVAALLTLESLRLRPAASEP
jgi:hypothetical protein